MKKGVHFELRAQKVQAYIDCIILRSALREPISSMRFLYIAVRIQTVASCSLFSRMSLIFLVTLEENCVMIEPIRCGVSYALHHPHSKKNIYIYLYRTVSLINTPHSHNHTGSIPHWGIWAAFAMLQVKLFQ